jgi:hypothetical protein
LSSTIRIRIDLRQASLTAGSDPGRYEQALPIRIAEPVLRVCAVRNITFPVKYTSRDRSDAINR